MRVTAVILSGMLVTYLVTFLILYLHQNRLMFSTAPAYTATPATYSLPYEEVCFSSLTGSDRLYGWWIPQALSEQVLLYVRGPYQNMGLCFDELNRYRIEAFVRAGYSILIFDYRGTGNSSGHFPTEAQIYADVEAAWIYLTQERQISPQQITIYGLSFGGAIALHLALQQPQARGLILEGTFTSILAMLHHRQQFWMFPRRWLVTQRFDSLSKIGRLPIPLLLIHGTADEVVPLEMGQQLWRAAPQPKQLFLVEGANHCNLGQVAGEAYFQRIQEFVIKPDSFKFSVPEACKQKSRMPESHT